MIDNGDKVSDDGNPDSLVLLEVAMPGREEYFKIWGELLEWFSGQFGKNLSNGDAA